MRDFIELLKAFRSYIINLIILFIGAFIRLYGCIYCAPSARPVNNRVKRFCKCLYICIRLKRCNA